MTNYNKKTKFNRFPEDWDVEENKKKLTKFQTVLIWIEIFISPVFVAFVICIYCTVALKYNWNDEFTLEVLSGSVLLGIVLAELIRRVVGFEHYNEVRLNDTSDIDTFMEENRRLHQKKEDNKK